MAAQPIKLSPGFMTQVMRQGVALGLCATMLPFTQLSLMAQEGPQQQYPVQDPGDYGQQGDQGYNQQPMYEPQGPQELERLVAPIALYPDSLVAQTLAAATYPQQVQEANNWMQQYGNQPPEVLAQQANGMPWDPSVKALTQFPTVLDMLARGQQWTIALGNAYYNQPADVMTAVQSMRYRAREAGQLRSSQQLVVVDEGPEIVIQPVNPQVVYVPYYDPWSIYGAPIEPCYGYYRPLPPPGYALGIGLAIGFGIGIGIGAFSHFGWGYHAWAPNWRSNTIIVNNNTYISRSTTVINNGHYGAYNQGFDRGGARGFAHATFNRQAPLYNGRPIGPQNRPAASIHPPMQNIGVNRPAPASYRPGAPVNRPGAPSTFNRPAAQGFQSNAPENRPGVQPGRPMQPTNRPSAPVNQPMNRPAAPAYRPTQPNYSRPAAPAYRPEAPAYRPAPTGNYSRPTGTTSGYSRPAVTNNRPAAPAPRPQVSAPRGGGERPQAPKQQSRPSGGEHEHHR